MKNQTYSWLVAIMFTLITGAVILFVVPENAPNRKVKDKTIPLTESANHFLEPQKKSTKPESTVTAKHTIIIENVDDPRQLQEILTLLESYSAEHKIKDLNIKTSKEKTLQ